MQYIQYINGTSGSSGNCHLLAIEALHTVIFLDLGVPYKTVNGYMKEIDFDVEHIVVCVTHEHKDHWKATTYNRLKESYDDVYLMFRKFPISKGKEGIRFFANQIVADGLTIHISQHQFSHGSTESSIYRIMIVDTVNHKRIETLAYGTDIDMTNGLKLEQDTLFKNLDMFILEASYDERHLMDLIENPQHYLSYGYDVAKGFVRHLSRQQSERIMEKQTPKEYMFVHQSSRFYEYKKGE